MSFVFLGEFLPKLGPLLLRLEFFANTQRQVERRLIVLRGTFVCDDGLEPGQERAVVVQGVLDTVHEGVVRGCVARLDVFANHVDGRRGYTNVGQQVTETLVSRLKFLDGPKVVHGVLLVTRTAEHLRVEFSASVEEVGTVVDKVLFEGGAFVLEIRNLCLQRDDSCVELLHRVLVNRALNGIGRRAVELTGGIERGQGMLERNKDRGSDPCRPLLK